jgi:hypothetical protein
MREWKSVVGGGDQINMKVSRRSWNLGPIADSALFASSCSRGWSGSFLARRTSKRRDGLHQNILRAVAMQGPGMSSATRSADGPQRSKAWCLGALVHYFACGAGSPASRGFPVGVGHPRPWLSVVEPTGASFAAIQRRMTGVNGGESPGSNQQQVSTPSCPASFARVTPPLEH